MKLVSTLAAAAGDPEVISIPGFDVANFFASIGLTAGTWFGLAIATGLGAGLIASVALVAVGRLKKSLSK